MIFLSDEIQRSVYYLHMQAHDAEATPIGENNSWIYDRAPEGMLFLLHSVEVSTRISSTTTKAIFAMFDGHEFTNWLLFPGVQSNEHLTRTETTYQHPQHYAPLNLWKCKEFTLAGRSLASAEAPKHQIIVWYYLKKASRKELMEYAIKHPRNQDMFKYALRGTTVEPSEANG